MSSAGPLAGKRILVTRAREQAGAFVEALEKEGACVVRLPAIAISPPESYLPLDSALHRMESFDWIVFTSCNAVHFLFERMSALSINEKRLAHAKVAAIGPATANCARDHGLSVELMPQKYVAESLAESFQAVDRSAPENRLAGKRFLLPRAAAARDVVPRELLKLGAELEVVEVYRTIVPAGSIDQARSCFEEAPPDAVTFTSSSTVTNFFALLAAAGIQAPGDLRAVSIGPITTAALREHDWEPAAEAAEAKIPALVDACVRLFQQESKLPGRKQNDSEEPATTQGSDRTL